MSSAPTTTRLFKSFWSTAKRRKKQKSSSRPGVATWPKTSSRTRICSCLSRRGTTGSTAGSSHYSSLTTSCSRSWALGHIASIKSAPITPRSTSSKSPSICRACSLDTARMPKTPRPTYVLPAPSRTSRGSPCSRASAANCGRPSASRLRNPTRWRWSSSTKRAKRSNPITSTTS